MNADHAIVARCARDVEQDEKFYRALSEEPWLRIEFRGPLPAGRWIELRYATSFFDPLARPVLRCFLKDNFLDEILPGALFGKATWVGFIPKGTQEIWISPTHHAGPFSFSIEGCTKLSHAQIIWRGLRQNPKHCLLGMGAQLIGLRHFAKVELQRSVSIKSLATYNTWRRLRIREMDPVHFDAPRTDWAQGPHIRLVVFDTGGRPGSLNRLVSELRTQPYRNWSVVMVSSSTDFAPPMWPDDGLNGGLSNLAPDAPVGKLLEALAETDIVAPIWINDSIPPYVLPVLAEAANRDLKTEIFYGDEEFIGESGNYFAPQLRPDWSAATRTTPFGTAKFFRVGFLMKRMPNSVETLRPMETATIDEAESNAVVTHVRRVMRTRRGQPSVHAHVPRMLPTKNTRIGTRPRATLIIPTKDRFDLLHRCLESLEKQTCLEDVEVIIVDNGTVQPAARRLLDQSARHRHFRVISRLGPFNFASFCNDAAAEALAPTLVFLNNDTEMIDPAWLDPLLDWAQRPDVGAVGSKLLYPNRRVQHAGVFLGIGGRAGHFERLLGTNDPGYLGRLYAPHEVSSVTAACLAVDKRKFDAVNGFDALNLPVELNDIDLCLRLSERGWKSVLVPESVLIHRESASRGLVPHPDKTYGKEHQYFRTRWIHRLRDDPFFHPALSLHAHHPALD